MKFIIIILILVVYGKIENNFVEVLEGNSLKITKKKVLLDCKIEFLQFHPTLE